MSQNLFEFSEYGMLILSYFNGGFKLIKYKRAIPILLLISILLLQGCAIKNEKITSELPESGEALRPIFVKTYSFEQATSLDDVYDVYTEFYFDYNPSNLDFIGDVTAFGYDNPKRFFPEISVEAEQILIDVNTRAIKALESLDLEPNSSDYYDKEVLLWFLRDQLNQQVYAKDRFFAFPNFGRQATVSTVLLDLHEINTYDDAVAYIERVKDAGRYLDDIYNQVELGIESGVMIPKSNAFNLHSELRSEAGTLGRYKDKLNQSLDGLNIDNTQKKQLLSRYDEAEQKYLAPSLAKLVDQSFALFKDSLYDNGLSEYPNGKSFYENYVIPHHVGYEISAEEIHQLGLSEVERITEELKTQFEKMGFDGSISEGIHFVQQSSEQFRGQDAFDEYERVMDEMYAQLPKVFHQKNIPLDNPTVRFFDYNSYLQPSIDGSREGYFNIVNSVHLSYAIVSLAIHEASPGHHLQISNVLNNPDTRLLRKLLRTTSYVEGWALYSEKLALESGFVKSDDVVVGMLLSELFRAGRLVVDTGLHYYDWTQQDAENYLKEVIFMGYPQFEVMRYTTWPGQALAYKMGELKILELRDEAMIALGDKFDIKDFHSAILDDGYLPLMVLEKRVHQYIEANK